MSCANINCNNDPVKSLYSIVVSIDGDLACCEECYQEYERQKSKFFNDTVHDSKKTKRFLLGY